MYVANLQELVHLHSRKIRIANDQSPHKNEKLEYANSQ